MVHLRNKERIDESKPTKLKHSSPRKWKNHRINTILHATQSITIWNIEIRIWITVKCRGHLQNLFKKYRITTRRIQKLVFQSKFIYFLYILLWPFYDWSCSFGLINLWKQVTLTLDWSDVMSPWSSHTWWPTWTPCRWGHGQIQW